MFPQKIQFRPSEIASDTFTLVLIMHLGVIDVEAIVDTWNRKSTRRIGSCLGQDLYILAVFNLRVTFCCIFLVLDFSSVSIISNNITL